MESPYLLLAAYLVTSLVLLQINQRLASPVLSIVDRWLRWVVFSLGAALLCQEFDWIDRPFWVLAVAFFLLWFLVGTLYNWVAISALSVSPLPFFPKYTLNRSGAEWPIQPRFLRAREWMRDRGFRQIQALRAEVGGGVYLRVSVYENTAGNIRLQVTFVPQSAGAIAVCYAFTSLTADGSRYVTDNVYIPFAGFFPEKWHVDRVPRCRSLQRLFARHQARLAAAGAGTEPFPLEPLADLNAAHHELDRLNIEMGFLHPYHKREDHGKITHEGRYRVWKEIWTLNYLGRSARY
jgi:hypothetical protein